MLKKTEAVGHIEDIILENTSNQHRVLCISPAISEIKTLDELIGCKVTHTPLMLNNACAVIMYGSGRSARKVLSASTALELPLLFTEFGPLKTFNHKKDQSLSMTFDHLGALNASDRETYLESLIKQEKSKDEIARAEQLIVKWKSVRASKDNHSTGPQVPDTRYVVVIAEPTPAGGSNKDSEAVTAALHSKAERQFPGHQIVVLPAASYAADLLAGADAVFVYSAPLGLEALIWGVDLYVSGMPFYAGWGLTEDELPAPARRSGLQHGLAQLIDAYLIKYTRYVNPFDSKRLSPEEALELVQKARPAALEHARADRERRSSLPNWLKWLWR